jgi:hypothetical protein
VRAIWSALLHETPLYYINPPPTFTESSQRLRTPSDTIEGRRGTCIDLALLLAACLEYVDIYPAIILLKTHAFPAYWRNATYHTDFKLAKDGADGVGTTSDAPSAAVQRYGWHLQRGHWPEVVRQVQAGRLVPLETVWLTQRASFADAIDEGLRNLSGRGEFDSMIDVNLARSDKLSPVTPLPIRREDV